MTEPRVDLTRVTLSVVFILALILASAWTIRPFLGAGIWATMLVVATWPLLLRAQELLGGRRWAAVTAMTLAMALVLVVPSTLAIMSIASNAGDVSALASRLASGEVPLLPDWVTGLPLVGKPLAEGWAKISAPGAGGLATYLRPYTTNVVQWFLARLGDVGGALVQFLLTLGIAAVMYATGESAVAGVRAFAKRLLGDRGPPTIDLAGKAVRSVALGVVVTALLQSALAGIGLAVAGVPYAAVFTVVMFILCIAQVGPWFVMIPAVIWEYSTRGGGWGTGLLIWTLIVGVGDNVVRPWLITRGAKISLMLILPGVIGGLISFGLLGVFIGPVLVVVTYTLLEAWVRDDHMASAASSSSA
ncbi:MAG TPA: AI-2E family transporter YdiK [Gemmatimonadaceae bacterium]|nr:AI-2E family transporter YdiK [Gemmatimonadaceae bacterium]